MTHCNDCRDILHKYVKEAGTNTDILTLIMCQFVLFIVVCVNFNVDTNILKHLVMSGLVIFIIGFISSRISLCNIGTRSWNMIMERFMIVFFIFIFIYKSQVSIFFKIAAFAITCCVGFFEICSRRHYTSDLIITLTFSYLVIGMVDCTKLGLSASVVTGIAFFCTMTIVLLFFVVDIGFNGNHEVSQEYDQIRSIIIELFTVLSVASLILFSIYHCDGVPSVSTSLSVQKLFGCQALYFVCVIIVTFFYFSLIKNVNVAFTAILIIIILFLFAFINAGFGMFVCVGKPFERRTN